MDSAFTIVPSRSRLGDGRRSVTSPMTRAPEAVDGVGIHPAAAGGVVAVDSMLFGTIVDPWGRVGRIGSGRCRSWHRRDSHPAAPQDDLGLAAGKGIIVGIPRRSPHRCLQYSLLEPEWQAQSPCSAIGDVVAEKTTAVGTLQIKVGGGMDVSPGDFQPPESRGDAVEQRNHCVRRGFLHALEELQMPPRLSLPTSGQSSQTLR